MVTYLTARARIITDDTGHALELPVVIGPNGPLAPMLRYQVVLHARSISWHRDLCFAVRMLLEYASANPASFSSRLELFESFSVRIRSGTFGADGLDPSGLYWIRRSNRRANILIACLSDFSSWLGKPDIYGAQELNPMRDATVAEHVLAAAAWAQKNEKSFLGHTESKAKAYELMKRRPSFPRYRETFIDRAEPPRFPHRHFWRLLFVGFATHKDAGDPWLRLDLRCVLITLLQHGGALRPSETFHAWAQDVVPDPTDPYRALVRIGHPSESNVEVGNELPLAGRRIVSRADYLQHHGLIPRDQRAGKVGVGWKDPKVERSHVIRVYWRSALYGRLFLLVWVKYMQQRRQLDITHPWAFVNLRNNIGAPYQLSDYRKAHAAAVRRIGLIPSKTLGTTPYGHRHDYIGFCADAGISSQVIRTLAHHKSVDSQDAYKQPGAAKIQSDIENAIERLESGPPDTLSSVLSTFGLTTGNISTRK